MRQTGCIPPLVVVFYRPAQSLYPYFWDILLELKMRETELRWQAIKFYPTWNVLRNFEVRKKRWVRLTLVGGPCRIVVQRRLFVRSPSAACPSSVPASCPAGFENGTPTKKLLGRRSVCGHRPPSRDFRRLKWKKNTCR